MVIRQVYLPKDIHGNLSPNQSRLSFNCCYRQSLKTSQNQQNIARPIYKAANIHSHVGFPDILSTRWVVLSELDHRPVSDLRPVPTISGSAVVSLQCLGQDCYLNSYIVWLPLLLLLLLVLLFLLLLLVHPNQRVINGAPDLGFQNDLLIEKPGDSNCLGQVLGCPTMEYQPSGSCFPTGSSNPAWTSCRGNWL